MTRSGGMRSSYGAISGLNDMHPTKRKLSRRVIACLVTLTTFATPASQAFAASAKVQPSWNIPVVWGLDLVNRTARKPVTFEIASGNTAVIKFSRMRWVRWGTPTATATGNVHVCRSTCSPLVRATLVLTGLEDTTCSGATGLVYTRYALRSAGELSEENVNTPGVECHG
jgi:hypothetical protein